MSTITIRKYNPDTARYELPDPWAGAPEGVRLIVREGNSFGPQERVVDERGIAWGKSRHTGQWVTTAQPRGGQTGTVEWYLNGGLAGQLVEQRKPAPVDPWAGAPEGVRLITDSGELRVITLDGRGYEPNDLGPGWRVVYAGDRNSTQADTVDWYVNRSIFHAKVVDTAPAPVDPWKHSPQGRRFERRHNNGAKIERVVLSGKKLIYSQNNWDGPHNPFRWTAEELLGLGFTEVTSPSYTPPLDRSVKVVQFRDGAKWFFDGTKQKYYQVGSCSHSHPQIMSADDWKKAFESEPEPKVLVSA